MMTRSGEQQGRSTGGSAVPSQRGFSFNTINTATVTCSTYSNKNFG